MTPQETFITRLRRHRERNRISLDEIVRLDPSDTVDEFCRLFPHGDRRAEQTFRDFAAIVAHDSAYQDQLDATRPDRRRRAGEEAVAEPAAKVPSTWRDQLLRLIRTVRNLRAPVATHIPYDR